MVSLLLLLAKAVTLQKNSNRQKRPICTNKDKLCFYGALCML
jgi:hypothetical protein